MSLNEKKNKRCVSFHIYCNLKVYIFILIIFGINSDSKMPDPAFDTANPLGFALKYNWFCKAFSL